MLRVSKKYQTHQLALICRLVKDECKIRNKAKTKMRYEENDKKNNWGNIPLSIYQSTWLSICWSCKFTSKRTQVNMKDQVTRYKLMHTSRRDISLSCPLVNNSKRQGWSIYPIHIVKEEHVHRFKLQYTARIFKHFLPRSCKPLILQKLRKSITKLIRMVRNPPQQHGE